MKGVRTLPPVFIEPLRPLPIRFIIVCGQLRRSYWFSTARVCDDADVSFLDVPLLLPLFVPAALAFSRIVLADASEHCELLSPTTQVVRAPELSVHGNYCRNFSNTAPDSPELAVHVEMMVQRLQGDVKCQAGLFLRGLDGTIDAVLVESGDWLASSGVHLEARALLRRYFLHVGEVLLACGKAFLLSQAE